MTTVPESVRRRRVIVVLTLIVGTTLLGLSLATTPGDGAFYPLTLAVAVVWVIGGVLSGPLHLGHERAGAGRDGLKRPLLVPLLIGVICAGVFVVGSLVVREIGPLHDVVAHVLRHATRGDWALVYALALVNGLAEEVFFRGAVYAGAPSRHAALITTIVYVLVTVATWNPMLVFAAVLMGTVFVLQRRATGGILASMITHLVWSAILLAALPPLFGV